MKRPSIMLTLCALLGGCAVSARAPGPTTAAEQGPPGMQIHELEARIAERRAALGLPRQDDESVPLSRPGAAQEAAPGSRAAVPEAAPGAAPAAAPGGGGRCAGVCQASDEICDYSRRICQLAAEIADASSQRSCARSTAACDEARGLCGGCR